MSRRRVEDDEPIAIVGAACRFPGANGLDQFWDVLANGRDVVSEIPDGRWSKEFYFHPNPGVRGKSYTWAAGIIDTIDRFDAAFFGLSPREAEQADPQQRLILELAWEALEDAGIPARAVAGGGAGVFIGASGTDYATSRMGDPASGDAYFMTGTSSGIVANRISHIFDLRGPSFVVDTACSSSLVALHQACTAIRSQRIPLALVGGINLLLTPYPFIGFCQATMLSPNGRCFAFDRRANGYVRSEGGAIVVLKPLKQAVSDGDHIRGLILGTGINSGGRTIGLALPSQATQAELLRAVYRKSGISPAELDYLEAHGTGTAAGDPVEISAIGDALARHRTSPLPIGSVKTNLGHLEIAAGMAGLLKAMLSLEKRVIPASLHFDTPNPNIPFSELNVAVASQPVPLPRDTARLIAGINSFGFGGANAHAIIASPPPVKPASVSAMTEPTPLLLSAKTEAALRTLAGEWSVRLHNPTAETASGMIRAAARRRDHHPYRLVAPTTLQNHLSDRLKAFSASEPSPGIVFGQAAEPGKLAFVYSGNGAQWTGMGRHALAQSSVFRGAIDEVDGYLRPLLGWSARDRLISEEDTDVLARTDVAQPLLFAVQVGITAALRAEGVESATCVGHSVGEIAAAWGSGGLPLSAACEVLVARSELQQRSQGCGRMAALAVTPNQAAEIVAKLGEGLEIAALNGRSSVTISGPPAAMARLQAEAARQGWHFVPLDLDYAFHTAALDPIRDDLLNRLDRLRIDNNKLGFVSTVTGMPISGEQLTASYWWRNIRDPVRFSDAMMYLIQDGFRIFVEIGPHPVLQSYMRDAIRSLEVKGVALSTLSRQTEDGDPFPALAAQCYAAGYDISGSKIFDGPIELRGLPLTPWQKDTQRIRPTSEAHSLSDPLHDHALLGFRSDSNSMTWSNLLDTALHPWLADHIVDGVPILPAAAMIEMALAAGRAIFPEASTLELSDFEIPHSLSLDQGGARELRIHADNDGYVKIEARQRFSDEPWSLHGTGRVRRSAIVSPKSPPTINTLRIVDAAEFYDLAARLGLQYGPHFRTVSRVHVGKTGEAIVDLDSSLADVDGENFLLHPALLDGALQGFLALLNESGKIDSGESFLPGRFGRVRVFVQDGRKPARALLTVTRMGSRSACGKMILLDRNSVAIADIAECWFLRVRLNRRSGIGDRAFHFALTAVPRLENQGSPLLEGWPSLVKLQQSETADGAIEETALLMDAYCAAAAYKPVQAIAQARNEITVADLVSSGALAPESAPLFGSLLVLLERHGVASRTKQGWHIAAEMDLPQPELIWRTVVEGAPKLGVELALAATASVSLPQILGGGIAALTPTLVDQFLYSSPAGDQALHALSDRVLALAAEWPTGRPLRILEIGAGRGAVTRRLLRSVEAWTGTLTYLVSDPDPDVVGYLAITLEGEADVSVRRWDPRDPGGEPDLLQGCYDLVISAFGLTRLALDTVAFAALRTALAPGGFILTVEPAPNALWDFVFGLAPDWWRATQQPDFPVSPLREGKNWCAVLAQAGFTMPSSVGVPADPWAASVIIARGEPRVVHPAAMASTGRAIIVAAAHDPLAGALNSALSERGMKVESIVQPEATDGAAFLAALTEAADEGAEIVALPPASRADGHFGPDATERLVAVATLAKLASIAGNRARLWIVTRGAYQGSVAIEAETEAALWGLGRTIANEMAQIDCRLLDMPQNWSSDEQVRCLRAEILLPDREREIVWTEAGRHALRLRRSIPGFFSNPVASLRNSGPRELTIAQPGRLESLTWKNTDNRRPGPGEVAIEVRAAGLNFRDVMWAMGLLPEEAIFGGLGGAAMGLECAGIVRELGPGVEGLSPGDRVIAFAPASLSSYAITSAHCVAILPDAIDFAAGATIPVAYLTAVYALGNLAQIEAGEHVLIHSGTGGVGLAAIHYARHRGAIVIATAGSETKREFLRHLGVEHIFDSRSLAFADGVMQVTGGAGVDIVLNSLSGEGMERSLDLLRPFGRFLELGKRDFYLNSRIGMRPLRKNISYFAIDLENMLAQRPLLAKGLLRDVGDLMEQDLLRPLPYRIFHFADAAEAFRLMQTAGHIGKIVLVPDEAPSHQISRREPPSREFSIRADGSYLVTGGLTGFGLKTARWLVAHGARHVALIGRRGANVLEAVPGLDALRDASADIRIFACDVADEKQLGETLAEIRRSMPPLRGIVHAAMVIDDGLIGDLTAPRIRSVLAPKLYGAINLDRLTREDPLELFLLYSSATTVLGAPGQGSYVAANLALEALARRRAAEGLPALAIAWGPIADAGYLAREEATRDSLQRRLGAIAMTAAEALDNLPALWSTGLPVLTFAAVRWESARRHLPILATPTFSSFVGPSGTGEEDLRERLAEISPDEATGLVVAVLTEEVARIMSASPSRIDPHQPLSEIGMDSLMAVELRLALESRLGIDIPILSLSDGTTLTKIAARIVLALSDESAGDMAQTVAQHETVIGVGAVSAAAE